jgi:hypothetical protein
MTESERGYKEMKMFAFFGRTIYHAQTIEGIMATALVIDTVKTEKITKTRYDEIYYERSRQTFGQLKRDIKKLNLLTEEEFQKIDKAHDMRDYLSHNYLADRVVEFQKEEHWDKVIEELSGQWDYFMEVYEIIESKVKAFIAEYDFIDINAISSELLSKDSTPEIEKFRELTRNEIVTDIYSYANYDGSKIIIFQLEDGTHWTIGERGLSQFKSEIPTEKAERIPQLEKSIFPIKQFNPKPTIRATWDYDLDLKINGLVIGISPAEGYHFKWKIFKKPK